MTGIHLADTDVVAVFHEHFGQREGQAIHVVNIALEEEHSTLLVRNRGSVRQLGSGAESIQDGLFVVVAGNPLLLTEHAGPFVGTLIIDSVEAFVEDWFNNTSKVGTAHRGCHFLCPPYTAVPAAPANWYSAI